MRSSKVTLGYKRPCLKQKDKYILTNYILSFRVVYSSNNSVKNYEEEILKKMRVDNGMLEKKAGVSFQEHRNSPGSILGKSDIPADVTRGGGSFISRGEMFCWIYTASFAARDLMML